MSAEKLRCQADCELTEKLLSDRLVKRVIEQLEKEEEKGPRGVRRRLLGHALRLSPTMSPKLHEIIADCRGKLGVDTPMETYVFASSAFNAACVKPEAGRLFVLLSAGLLEAFPDNELRFVVGHELGHHLFGHHDIPVGAILDGSVKPSPELALRLFSWSRYAEISADRAGASCATDPDAVASALFRLASGLRGDLVTVRIDEFAAQVDDMRIEGEDPAQRPSESEWFSTHPFSPLRVKALKFFAESELFVDGGNSLATLEAQVATLMALMEPSYLDEKSEEAEAMRRLLFAGAIAVADASDGISEAEIAVFEKFFGEGAFSDKLDVEAIKNDLSKRTEHVKEAVRETRRIQLLRDLCVVLRADGRVEANEVAVLKQIAAEIDVPEVIVDQTLTAVLEPD